MSGSKGNRYDPEFIRGALRLRRESGKSRSQIASDLGVSGESLRRWELLYTDDGRKRLTPEAAEHAEVERLKKELRISNEEREVLKKVRHALLGTTKDENPRYRSTFLQPDI